MSEVLKFDTTTGFVAEDNKPYTVLHESFSGLRKVMPEFDVSMLPNQAMNNVITNLKMTMKLYGAIGIAANQVGILERFFLIGTDQFQIVCFNPEVVNLAADLKKEKEVCLSHPGLAVTIERPSGIDVKFYNENGELQEVHVDGLTARCFLHELDHLNGIRMIDRVKPVALQMARKKQSKMIQQYVRNKNNGKS